MNRKSLAIIIGLLTSVIFVTGIQPSYSGMSSCHDFDSQDPVFWYEKGKELYDQGSFEDSIQCYDIAIKFNPDYIAALFQKGWVLGVKLGHIEEAESYYVQATKIEPQNTEDWLFRGHALSMLDDSPRALESYDMVLEMDPANAEGWLGKGMMSYNLGTKDSLVFVEKSLEFDPTNGEAWLVKGNMLSWVGRNEAAIDAYDKGISFNPEIPKIWFKKGVAHTNLEQYREAIMSYDGAINIEPNFVDAWAGKGLAFEKLEYYEDSIDSYEKVLKIRPNDMDAWFGKTRSSFNLVFQNLSIPIRL